MLFPNYFQLFFYHCDHSVQFDDRARRRQLLHRLFERSDSSQSERDDERRRQGQLIFPFAVQLDKFRRCNYFVQLF